MRREQGKLLEGKGIEISVITVQKNSNYWNYKGFWKLPSTIYHRKHVWEWLSFCPHLLFLSWCRYSAGKWVSTTTNSINKGYVSLGASKLFISTDYRDLILHRTVMIHFWGRHPKWCLLLEDQGEHSVLTQRDQMWTWCSTKQDPPNVSATKC